MLNYRTDSLPYILVFIKFKLKINYLLNDIRYDIILNITQVLLIINK